MGKIIEKEIKSIVDGILEDYRTERAIDKIDMFKQPDKEEIVKIISGLVQIVYPGYYFDTTYKIYNVDHKMSVKVEDVIYHLNRQIELALQFTGGHGDTEETEEKAGWTAVEFFRRIPAVRAVLETDVQAAFEGDPAAKSREEIIMAYPGLYAITVYRLAHELFLLKVPLIPRIMTEHAHSLTGIDIHPGAAVGKYFCIDHGTGIVVGETAVIGDHVKIYQGVTIGALSTRNVEKMRNARRHPTIEDNVTIYAGASILGGETIIGENTVIGGSVFITSSIPADTKVNMKNPELKFRPNSGNELKVQECSQSEEWYYVI
ncbi:MAG: serine acetyltransferase [Lachnospiraceae bacterium]|nr:serine acetyltransferase [Lachnospiraceae bacterium]